VATILRARAVVGLNTGSVACLLTTYWDSTGAGITALATEAIARVRAGFNAAASVIATGTTFTPTLLVDEVDEVTGAIVNQVAAAAPAAVSGALAATNLPLQTMGLLQFQTATFIAGRRLRGRLYIPGLTVNSVGAGSNPTAATITALAAFNTALGATVVTATNQRVWHRPKRVGGGAPSGGLSAVVATRSVSPSYAVMRSRRR
jgi:hypothetical protein